MDSQVLQRDFRIRYYNWARKDFEREIEQGFPFLSKFTGDSPWQAMDMMSNMTRQQQLLFATALVKRFHKEAVEAVGDQITSAETELSNQYLSRTACPSPSEMKLEQRLRAGEAGIYAGRRKLSGLVRAQFKSAGMQIFEAETDAGVLLYQTLVDDWQVLTRIHTRERYAQLAYDHIIWSVKKVLPVTLHDFREVMWPIQLHNWISLAGWLGISSRTQWCDLSDSEAPQAAKDLLVLCNHFLRAVPSLLEGLSP